MIRMCYWRLLDTQEHSTIPHLDTAPALFDLAWTPDIAVSTVADNLDHP